MNLLEALEALKNGKKVRRVNWAEEKYVYLDEGSQRLFDNKGDRISINPVFGLASINEILEEKWEIYNPINKLSFKGKILDIVKYCNCHSCNECIISPICEFSKESDLRMGDFLMEIGLDALNEPKIDKMYKYISC